MIGFPLSHSFSKKYFDEKFKRESIEGSTFELFAIEEIEWLPQLLQQHKNLKGLAVTIPYKKKVLPYLHWQNPIVQAIQACNCIKVSDSKLYGFNTDVIGFKQSLLQHLQPHHKKALVLGTGGASAAIIFVLQELGIEFKTVSRKPSADCLNYESLDKHLISEHTLIINTTPLGTYPSIDDYPLLPYNYITKEHLFFDLVYNPQVTKFMSMGLQQNATVCNGYDMLIYQAEENWKIWNEV